MSQPESFLRRWSRLKLEAPAKPFPVLDRPSVLPSLETLDFNADFSAFMHPDVDGEARRNALRKLFMTDHYRAMDGLDVYVQDYSNPELLPSELLNALDHAQALLAEPEASTIDSPAEGPAQI